MKDTNGHELTLAELRKLLKKHTHPQYNWWHAKAQPRVGAGKPPPGVRGNVEISRL